MHDITRRSKRGLFVYTYTCTVTRKCLAKPSRMISGHLRALTCVHSTNGYIVTVSICIYFDIPFHVIFADYNFCKAAYISVLYNSVKTINVHHLNNTLIRGECFIWHKLWPHNLKNRWLTCKYQCKYITIKYAHISQLKLAFIIIIIIIYYA